MGRRLALILPIAMAIAVTVGLAGAGCAVRSGPLEKAQAAWDQGDYVQAANIYEQFIKDRGPESSKDQVVVSARFRLANIYFYNLKQYDRAIQHYIAIVEEAPRSKEVSDSRERIAECYVALGKLKEAISEYEEISNRDHGGANSRRIRLSIADLYYDLNDLGQALAEYEKVVASSAYDDLAERAWLRIAGIHFLRDEFGDALIAYRTVAEKTAVVETRRQARFGMADCLERTFEYDLAVKVLEETEMDTKTRDYVAKRVTAIRQHQRERDFSNPPAIKLQD
jgi:tetratricopeptide (TPR) repeat protein